MPTRGDPGDVAPEAASPGSPSSGLDEFHPDTSLWGRLPHTGRPSLEQEPLW